MARMLSSIIFTSLLLFLNSCYSHHVSLHTQTIAFIGDNSKTRRNATPQLNVLASTCPRGGGDTIPADTPVSNTNTTFDAQLVSNRLKLEEIQNVKKAQQFLKKQERRREMDKTWLDKIITGTVEFFENVFRWEVIDVKN
jgi:hypothetical protein